MNRAVWVGAWLLAGSLLVCAQETGASSPPPSAPATAGEQQQNAASAKQDTSGTSGDQITKPPGAKGSTLIGCLAGPDKDGKFMVRNMTHRLGVQVLGPEDLKNDTGGKVKLTGQWLPDAPRQEQTEKAKQIPRFQATDVEVLAAKCTNPIETTPVSKNKQGKPTTYNAPGVDEGK